MFEQIKCCTIVQEGGVMSKVVIDTSALLAVLLNEPERERLISLTMGVSLIAPKSLHWEIGNAFSAMFKRKKLLLAEAVKAFKMYQEIPIQFMEIDMPHVLSLCDDCKIYAYDAYMIDCSKKVKAPLLTLDQELIAIAKKNNVAVLEV